jgi:hypothetical protein
MNQPTASSSSSAAPIPRARRRLQRKLGPGVRIEAWGKAWVSRQGRTPGILAARTSDFVVCTADRLMLFSTGFFTRVPRRCVYDAALTDIRVTAIDRRRGHKLQVATRTTRHPLVLELSSKARNTLLASKLLQRSNKGEPE